MLDLALQEDTAITANENGVQQLGDKSVNVGYAETDIRACQGVVHIIDAVIFPKEGNSAQAFAQHKGMGLPGDVDGSAYSECLLNGLQVGGGCALKAFFCKIDAAFSSGGGAPDSCRQARNCVMNQGKHQLALDCQLKART